MSVEYIKGHWEHPWKKMHSFWYLWTLETRTQRTRSRFRIWAGPTAGPKISTVLEGILGRWHGLGLPARERTLTAVTQEKHLLFLCFDLFFRFFWIFFFSPPTFFPSLLSLSDLSTLWNPVKLFFLSHMFYCCYKPLPLWRAFAVLWNIPFSLSF